MRQPDLFDPDPTPDLFDENRQEKKYVADPAECRKILLGVLAEARAATEMPWTAQKLRYHQTVFPQMSRWLPEEEAAQLCFEFETEVKRLLAA